MTSKDKAALYLLFSSFSGGSLKRNKSNRYDEAGEKGVASCPCADFPQTTAFHHALMLRFLMTLCTFEMLDMYFSQVFYVEMKPSLVCDASVYPSVFVSSLYTTDSLVVLYFLLNCLELCT